MKTRYARKSWELCNNEEDREKVVQEFEEIIKKIESDFIWLVYHPGQIYQKFKEKERFVIMVSKFGVSQQ